MAIDLDSLLRDGILIFKILDFYSICRDLKESNGGVLSVCALILCLLRTCEKSYFKRMNEF